MITKEDLCKKLEESLKTVERGDFQQIIKKISELLKFAVENYADLSPDAKKIIENNFQTIQSFVGQVLQAAPESKDKRKLKRLYAGFDGEHYRAEQFIKILESAPELKEENSKQFRNIFVNRLQNIIDFLFDVSQNQLSGLASFGQMSLLYMCVNELLATFHLAQHRYISQAYSHIRNVFEHLDKIELFRTKPQWAEVWSGNNENEIRKELSPGKVRKKLGKPRYDPIYGLFSKLGPHGTFRSVQTSSASRIRSCSKQNPQITFWLGGCPLEHNIVFLNTFALFALHSTLLQLVTSFGKYLNEDECVEVLKKTWEEFTEYERHHFIPWARENKLDVTEMEDFMGRVDIQQICNTFSLF